MTDHSCWGKSEKFRPNTARADSHGAARSIQAWPRPLGSCLGDADDVAVAPAHPLADRARLALTPYGAADLQLCSHPVVSWDDAPAHAFGFGSFQMAAIRTGGDPPRCRLVFALPPSSP